MQTNQPYSKEAIEARLAEGVRDHLSVDEQSEMKASLLVYTTLHTVTPETSKKTPARNIFSWQRAVAGVCAVVMIVVGGAGVAASASLPGDTLYSLKVNLVEPTMATLEVAETSELQEQVRFLERRLLEVKQLEEAGLLDEESGAVVTKYVTESVRTIESTLDTSVAADEEISAATLHTIDHIQSVVEAQEIIFDTAAVDVSSEALADIGEVLEDAKTETVAALVEDGATSTIATYISDSLEDIEEKIATQEYAPTTVEMVESYIDDAYAEIAEADIQETYENVAEANQRLLTEEYYSEEVVD